MIEVVKVIDGTSLPLLDHLDDLAQLDYLASREPSTRAIMRISIEYCTV